MKEYLRNILVPQLAKDFALFKEHHPYDLYCNGEKIRFSENIERRKKNMACGKGKKKK